MILSYWHIIHCLIPLLSNLNLKRLTYFDVHSPLLNVTNLNNDVLCLFFYFYNFINSIYLLL